MERIRGLGPFYRDAFPVEEDPLAGACASAGHRLSPGVVSIKENERKDADFGGGVRCRHPGPGGAIDDEGPTEGHVGAKLLEELGGGRQGPVSFADAGGAQDDHPGEALAGDDIECVVEWAEEDLKVAPDLVDGR